MGFLLGLAPTRRFCFSVEDAHKYKRLIEEKLREWNIEFVNIDDVTKEGLLVNQEDARAAAELFVQKKVDAVFVPHVNFGTEEVIAAVCKTVNKPVLVWGPRDESPLPNGIHLRDTQCGLFATTNVLKKYGVNYTYLVNSRVESEVFKRGFFAFIGGVKCAKAFLGCKIGQIGTRPSNFYTVMINEQELYGKFGIEVVPMTALAFSKKVRKLLSGDERVQLEVEQMKASIRLTGNANEDSLKRMAAFKLVMQDFASEYGLSAIAFKCHDDIADDLETYCCFANGLLADIGLPVACETDIHGAISMVMLQSVGEAPVFLADLTQRHPTNNNSELLWHCGNFPPSLCKTGVQPFLSGHCNVAPGHPGTANFEIENGLLTIARFEGMNGEFSLFMGEGKSCEGPYNLGTYVWMEVPNWPLWEEKLMYGNYIHHVAGTYGHVAASLYEATRYIPNLTPDPAQPTMDEIRAYLRGDDLDE